MASKFDVTVPFDGQWLSVHDAISEAAGVALIIQVNEPSVIRATEESVAPVADKNFGYGTKITTKADDDSVNNQWESAPAAGEKTYVRAINAETKITVQTA